jgi:hypothetical protein
MPSEMTGEPKEAKRPRILKLGKANNIIQWTEEMKTSISILCGGAGNFLTTNVRHGSTIPREEGYLPVIQKEQSYQKSDRLGLTCNSSMA